MTRVGRWRAARRGLRLELPPLLRLAAPVVTAEIGWMTMGLVDTMMVGRVSAEAVGAVGVGGSVFFTLALFGIGLLLGLDYTIAHAYGAGRIDETRRWLVQGVYLAVLAALPGIAIVWWAFPYLQLIGIRPEVFAQALPYARALGWSLLPLLILTALRRYLQATGSVRPVMLAALSANVVNACANWVLIFGHLGFPALGAEGAGWATCLSRVYMAMFLAIAVRLSIRRDHRLGHVSLAPDFTRIRRLVALGLPAACQMGLECGVFAAATALAGRLEPVALAAHQIALNAASFTFMVPLGISSAGAVRVGQALGRRDPSAAGRAGWTALLLGALFMSTAGGAFVLAPRTIIRIFTPETAIIATGVSLLLVAAVFQLFDGLQVVATGILRGTGDTRTPMLSNLFGHWLLGLPIGYALCFWWGRGVVGLWVGLCIGLVAVAAVLVLVWAVRVSVLAHEAAPRTAGHAESRAPSPDAIAS